MTKQVDVLINALYMFGLSSGLYLEEIERQLAKEGGMKFEYKKKLNNLIDAVKKAKYCASLLDDDIAEAIGREYDGWDEWMSDANELCRLQLLWIDRIAGRPNAVKKMFDYLRKFRSGQIVEEETINKFYLK